LIATNEEKINSKTREISHLNKFGDSCDKCSRPFSDGDKGDISDKITNLTSEISDIQDLNQSSLKTQKDLDAIRDRCNKGIDTQKNNIIKINTNINHNNNIKDRISQLNDWNSQLTIDIDALNNETDDFDQLIQDSTTRKNALDSIVDGLKFKLDVLDSVKHVVSEEGVKSFIIKKLLQILNGKLAFYLDKLDAPCQFKFNEYFGEQIINDKGQECSYNNFSSGEKKRIDLAILFTFMDIRRLQGNTSLNITFYDEILDTSLDDKGIELFLEILNDRIEKYNEACYIISHKTTAVRAATNEIIYLEKKNGFTTVKEIKEIE